MNSAEPQEAEKAATAPSVRATFLSLKPSANAPVDLVKQGIIRHRLTDTLLSCDAWQEKFKGTEAHKGGMEGSTGWLQRHSLLPFAYIPDFHYEQEVVLRYDDAETDMSYTLGLIRNQDASVRDTFMACLVQEPEKFAKLAEECSPLQMIIDLNDLVYYIRAISPAGYMPQIGISRIGESACLRISGTNLMVFNHSKCFWKDLKPIVASKLHTIQQIVETPCAFRIVLPEPLPEEQRKKIAEERAEKKKQEEELQEKRRLAALKAKLERERAAKEAAAAAEQKKAEAEFKKQQKIKELKQAVTTTTEDDNDEI